MFKKKKKERAKVRQETMGKVNTNSKQHRSPQEKHHSSSYLQYTIFSMGNSKRET